MSIVGISSQIPQFSPQDFPGLSLWLDAADTNTLTLTASNVTQWRDKSGNGYHATGTGSTTLQQFNSTLQGITLSGTEYLTATSTTAMNTTNTLSAFVVASASSTAPDNYGRLLAFGDSGGDAQQTSNAVAFERGGGNLIAFERAAFASGSTYTAPFQFVGSMIFGTSTGTQFINGTSNASGGTTGAFNYSMYSIGRRSQGSFVWRGMICEVIAYNSELSALQRQTIEGYLARKWNVTVVSGHPYRLGGPGILPTTLPGCLIWLDAADSASVTRTGSNVTQWNDKSGNANHFTTRAGTPTYGTNEVAFTSGAIMRSTASITMSLNVYAIIVFKLATTNDSYMISFPNMSPGGFTGDYSIRAGGGILNGTPTWPYGNEGDFGGQGTYFVNGNFNPSFGSSTYSVPVIVAGKSTNAAMTGSTTVEISTTSMAPRYFVGSMYEVILYSNALTTAQRQQLEGYLAWKWGIVSSLPRPSTAYAASNIPMRDFAPTDIDGLAFWLDSADSTTLTLSGSNVTAWADKSGNGRNAAVSSTAFATAVPMGVSFNNSYYTTSYPANPANETFFTVFTAPASLAGAGGLIGTQTGGRTIITPGFGGTSNAFGVNASGVSGGAGVTGITASTRFLGVIQITGTSTTAALNGASLSSPVTITGFTGGTTTTLGRETSTLYPFNGVVHELVAYTASLSTTQRQRVESYLAGKWGLRGSMGTSAHPFRYGPPVVTPTSIPGCVLWLDAADSTSVDLSGTMVTTWRDKSGSSNNAQRTLGTPTLQTLDGRQGVYFATSTEQLTTTSNAAPTGAGGRSLFCVLRTPTGTSQVLLGYGSHSVGAAPSSFGIHATPPSTAVFAPYTYSTDNNSIALSNTNAMIVYADYNATSNTVSGSYNGLALQTRATATLSTVATPWYLGRRQDGNGATTGYIHEIVHYSTTLTLAERQQLEGYLAWKWGLFTNLPGASSASVRMYRSLMPAFNPLQVAGCLMWLDAADTGTVTFTGSNVSRWVDKSGNGYTMDTAPPSGLSLPVQGTPINGLSTVGINTLNCGIKQSRVLDGITNFFWVRREVEGNQFYFGADSTYDFHTGNSQEYASLAFSPVGLQDASMTIFLSNSITRGRMAYVPLVGVGNINLLCVSNITGSTKMQGLSYDRGNTFRSQRCDWGEILLYSNALSSNDITRVQGYLAWKWGIPSYLTSNHPLRYTKP